jgi:predicted metalloprotease with PDZ domain
MGVPEGAIAPLASEVAGSDLQPFFARFVSGTEDPPLAALLDAFGVDWHVRAAGGGNDRGGKAAQGIAPACWFGAKIGSDQALQHVFSGGPAERAGLAARDVLVAVDGLRASSDTMNALLARRLPGDRIRVHAFRRDELLDVAVELAAAPLDTCYLTLRSDVAPPVLALRNAWLAGA